MLRFTTRDLLWLTVVVSFACALVITATEQRSLKTQVGNLQDGLHRRIRDERAFIEELRRVTGRRVTGWTYVVDPSEPTGFRYTFDYEGDPTGSSMRPNQELN